MVNLERWVVWVCSRWEKWSVMRGQESTGLVTWTEGDLTIFFERGSYISLLSLLTYCRRCLSAPLRIVLKCFMR